MQGDADLIGGDGLDLLCGLVEEDVDIGRGRCAGYVDDSVVDRGPDGDWVLGGMCVGVLGHSLVVVFVFLINESDGHCLGGGEKRWICDHPISCPEADVT